MLASAVDVPLPLQPRLPQWAADAIAGGRLEMFAAVVPDAAAMAAEPLRAGVAAAYIRLGDAVRASGKTPIRLWNYLPDPGHVMGPGLDRYMVFNAGRYDGYQQWPDRPNTGRALATASGVGIFGGDLTIHCLASPDPAAPVENPRQTPAWRYSTRYGPMPPCFSRATMADVDGRRRLLIGGTASIVGEDSRHEHDALAQLEETLANLAALIRAARRTAEPEAEHKAEHDALALARLTDLRVYVVRAEDCQALLPVIQARCPGARCIELTTARLCRPELLVEIEGVAEI
jgi:chorismate lyase/3-hydroxybenzoate synthase